MLNLAGGAERLVVDAAVALKNRGHDVVIFTSRHDPKRCFEETRDGALGSKCLTRFNADSIGTLPVNVLGSSIPRQLHSRLPLTIIFSILRSVLLALLLSFSFLLPGPASRLNPLHGIEPFDVYIVDQQSVCVPILRLLTGTRVVFYCHFPDKLLSGGWSFGADKVERTQGSLIKRAYRWPIDKLEEWTTGLLSLFHSAECR
jgi:alpha-1,3/alpha-1,6-mannosyltransferase